LIGFYTQPAGGLHVNSPCPMNHKYVSDDIEDTASCVWLL